jgi:hypothetical protein
MLVSNKGHSVKGKVVPGGAAFAQFTFSLFEWHGNSRQTSHRKKPLIASRHNVFNFAQIIRDIHDYTHATTGIMTWAKVMFDFNPFADSYVKFQRHLKSIRVLVLDDEPCL